MNGSYKLMEREREMVMNDTNSKTIQFTIVFGQPGKVFVPLSLHSSTHACGCSRNKKNIYYYFTTDYQVCPSKWIQKWKVRKHIEKCISPNNFRKRPILTFSAFALNLLYHHINQFSFDVTKILPKSNINYVPTIFNRIKHKKCSEHSKPIL